MSTTFYAWCETCEANGPAIDRKAGGTALLDPKRWDAWLRDHEYHDLRLDTDKVR